jgi:hypothetical protein
LQKRSSPEAFEHEADLGLGHLPAAEEQVREQRDLPLRALGAETLDALADAARHVGEVLLEDRVLAREIVEEVARRHAGAARDVRKRGACVTLLEHAIVQRAEDVASPLAAAHEARACWIRRHR